ncbi:hypothetical protein SAMN05428984_4093 [Sphingomonas sp. OK281]|nr:hypothetical protein SAMN05428984_4093 [Sphingomonas sp. OK281]
MAIGNGYTHRCTHLGADGSGLPNLKLHGGSCHWRRKITVAGRGTKRPLALPGSFHILVVRPIAQG